MTPAEVRLGNQCVLPVKSGDVFHGFLPDGKPITVTGLPVDGFMVKHDQYMNDTYSTENGDCGLQLDGGLVVVPIKEQKNP